MLPMPCRSSDPPDKSLLSPFLPIIPSACRSLTGLPPPLPCGPLCACAGFTPNKARGPPLPPYRRVRILPPSLRHPGDWSVNSRPEGRVRRAAKLQAAPRPLLKEKPCQALPSAQCLNGT